VNELPDPHYATLRFVLGHLNKVQSQEIDNKMGIQNLAIVWGPTLLDCPLPHSNSATDFRSQARVIEIVLKNYSVIFD
jgi:hypothetical protein